MLRYFQGRRLDSIAPDDLRAYRLWLEEHPAKLAPSTVTAILADARCMLRWAAESGLIDRVPFPSRLMPRVQQQPPDRLTPEEEAKVRAIPEPWAFTIRFLLGTGLRWSEACRAQASDLQGNLLVVHHTKSGRVRRIPLDKDVGMDDILVHDAHAEDPTLAFLLSRLGPPHLPTPVGILRSVQHPVLDAAMHDQVQDVIARKGPGDLDALLHSGDTWTVS